MAFFPASDNGVGGSVMYGDDSKPNRDGTLIYLNGGDDLAKPFSRGGKGGRQTLNTQTSIGPNGFKAVIMDAEGNRAAFHSMK